MTLWLCMSSVTYSRSVLRFCLVASAAPAPAITTSADFSLKQKNRRAFTDKARSPQVRTHTFIAQPPHLRHPSLGHKSFMVSCPLALLDSAFYAVLVHQLTIYAPRFLPTLGRPHAVALHFAHGDQLAAGLAPACVRPCWAHMKKPRPATARGLIASASGHTAPQCATLEITWQQRLRRLQGRQRQQQGRPLQKQRRLQPLQLPMRGRQELQEQLRARPLRGPVQAREPALPSCHRRPGQQQRSGRR